jgi:predicted ATPase/DNA-binding SARP family transcriptional activator
MDPWRIQLLGELRATRGGEVVSHFRSQKVAGLLAFLAHHRETAHSREVLIEMFWPEGEPEAGRNNLSKALSLLRQQLEPGGDEATVLATRATVQLDPRTTTDVDDFRAALARAASAKGASRREALARALELYKGEFLAGHYQDWIASERDRLRASFTRAALELARALEAAGDRHGAIDAARRAVASEPESEDAARVLIDLHAQAGEPSAALRVFGDLSERLERELGTTPSATTRELARAVEASLVDTKPARRPGRALPLELRGIFGREEELARLESELRPGPTRTRLLTLTGPGGIGKTRLALETARRLEKAHEGPVAFVPLADVTDERFLETAILRALGLAPSPKRSPLDEIAAAIGSKPALLVLDNFEQLVPGGTGPVRGLLERAESLSCLVTSRRRLGIPGELEVVLAPLATPAGEAMDALAAVPSVRLFVERARAASPSFALTRENAPAVAKLVLSLEGIPLALALAAGRAQVLSPEQILERLPRELERFSDRGRDTPARHRTIAAAIEGSLELLSPENRQLFARLAVFRGGFTLEAAEAVAEAGSAADRLADLRECSLLGEESGGARRRLRMLETVREHALSHLESAELDALERRHAEFFLRLAEEARAHLGGPDQAAWLDRLAADDENLRAALASCRASSERARLGQRIGSALVRYWDVRGLMGDGRRLLRDVLEASREPSPERAGALAAAGILAMLQGDYADARALHEESLALFREFRNEAGVVRALNNLGNLALGLGDSEVARVRFEECRGIARTLGDRDLEATATFNVAMALQARGEPRNALSLFEESLVLRRALGNKGATASSLRSIASAATDLGTFERAQAAIDEALAIFRLLGHEGGVADALYLAGQIREHRGEDGPARALYEESLALYRKRGSKRGAGACLLKLARLAARGRDPGATALLDECLVLAPDMDDRSFACDLAETRGDVARAAGDLEAARRHYAASLSAARDTGSRRGIADRLERFALLEHRAARGERAALLLAAASALRENIGTPVPPCARDELDALRAALVALPAPELDEAIALALGERSKARPDSD